MRVTGMDDLLLDLIDTLLSKKDVMDDLVNNLLNQGVIQHSNSPYASPTVLV